MSFIRETIVAIDPALTTTGIITLCGRKIKSHRTIRTSPTESIISRLTKIYSGVQSVLQEASPSLIIMEYPMVAGRGARNILSIALEHQAVGAILAALTSQSAPILLVIPTRAAPITKRKKEGLNQHEADALHLALHVQQSREVANLFARNWRCAVVRFLKEGIKIEKMEDVWVKKE